MTGHLVGYARCAVSGHDVPAEQAALTALGVDPTRIHLDRGLTQSAPERPGLRAALTACRPGDVLVVTKLYRLARSVPDARKIIDELTARQVRLNLGGTTHDLTGRTSWTLPTALTLIADFEADLARAHTCEGLDIARAKGHLQGGARKLSPAQEAHLVRLWHDGDHTTLDLAHMFGLARGTVYRIIRRVTARTDHTSSTPDPIKTAPSPTANSHSTS